MAAPIITDIEINTARSQQSVQKLREEMVSLGVTAERIDFLLANNNNTFLKQISTRDALARAIRQYTAIEEQAAASLKRGETTLAQYNFTLNQGIAAISANAAKREAMAQAVAKEAASIGGATQAHATYADGQQKSAAAAQRGTSAIKLQAHELAMLGQQIQDVGVSLAGGQNPFLVIAQQAPQAAYAVGGFSNLYKIAMQAILSPTGLAVIGIGSLAAGMALVGSRVMDLNANSREFGVAIRAMGNDAVVTTAQLQKMVTALKEQGVASDEAKAIVASTARNRGLTGAGMARVTGNSPDFSAAFNVSVADAAKQISDMATGGYDAVKKLHEAYGLLTAAEMENIRTLFQSGQSAEAVEKAFAGLEKRIASAARESRSAGTNAWIDLKNSLSDLLDEVAKSEPVVVLMERLAGAFKGLANAIRPADKATLAAAVKPEVIAELKRNIGIQEADVARLSALQRMGGSSPVENLAEELNSAQFKLEAYRKALDDATKSTDGFKEATGQAAAGVGGGEASTKTGLNTSALNDQADIIKARGALTGAGAYARAIGEADIKTAQMALDKKYDDGELAVLKANNRKEALLGLNDALAKTAQSSRIEAAETLKVAEAYKISTAAGQIAAAQRQAAVDAYTTGANVEIRTRQILLDKVREQIDTASAQREANAIEVTNAERLAAAQKIGVGAYVDVELAIKKETETRQARIALQVAEQNGFSEEAARLREMIALREQQIDLIDKETRAAQLAADMRKANQDVEIAGMQEKISMLTDVNERRAAEIALARRQQEISLANDPRYANDPEAREALLSKGDKVRALQDNARFYDEVRQQAEGLSKDVSQFLVDGFVNAERGGKSAFQNLWDGALAGAKRFAAQVAAQFLQQRILMPIAMQIVGGSPGSFGIANPGGSSSGGFRLPGFGGGGDFGGIKSAIDNWGATNLGTASSIGSTISSTGSTSAPALASTFMDNGLGGVSNGVNAATGGSLGSGVTLTQGLGAAAGIGGGIYQIIAGKGSAGSIVGGASSMAAGLMSLSSAAGPYAPLVAVGGMVLSSLLGGKKPSVGPGGGIGFGAGADGKINIGFTSQDNGYDPVAKNSEAAQSVVDGALKFFKQVGGTFAGTGVKDRGAELGYDAGKKQFVGGDDTSGGKGRYDTLEQAMAASLIAVVKNSIVTGVSKDIQDRIKAVNTSQDMEDLLQYIAGLNQIYDTFKNWAPPLTAAEQSINGLTAAYEQAKAAADSLSKSTDDLKASFEKQKAYLVEQFNAPLIERELRAKGKTLDADLMAFDRAAADTRKAAKALGPQAEAQAEKTLIVERIKIIQDAMNAQNQARLVPIQQAYDSLVGELKSLRNVWAGIAEQMIKFRDSLKVGALSTLDPEQQMLEAQRQYSETLKKARGGDVKAAGELQNYAQQALQQTQGYYASGAGYAAYFDEVQGDLTSFAAYASDQVSVADQQLGVQKSIDASARTIAQIMQEMNAAKRAGAAVGGSVGGGAGGGTGLDGGGFGNGSLSVEQNIANAYKEHWGRDASAGEIKAWTDLIDQGKASASGAFASIQFAPQATAMIAQQRKMREFAGGGDTMAGEMVKVHPGELLYTGPQTRVFNPMQSARMMSGANDNAELTGLVRTLIGRIDQLTMVSAEAGDGNNGRLDELRSELNSLTRTLKNSQLVA